MSTQQNVSKALQEHTLLIGAYGWRHAAWQDDFYPDDLPEEWQLGYYGNEYPVVLVPASYWDTTTDEITEWLEETDESPGFICEWPGDINAEADAQKLLGVLSQLGTRLLGILLVLDAASDEKQLSLVTRLSKDYALCLDVQPGCPASVAKAITEYASNENIGFCWHGDADETGSMSNGRLVVARIKGKELDPRTMRFVVEQCIKQSGPERHVALIFDGDPPSLQQMTNAGVIRDLL